VWHVAGCLKTYIKNFSWVFPTPK